VRTIFRRTQSETAKPEVIQAGSLTIDVAGHSVTRADHSLELTPTEFAILVTLANQPKRVLSRMQIMQQALGESFEGYERTIDAHVKNLRNKLEPDPKKPRYIHTVFGVGYKFEDREDEARNA
jgi:two-component system alkaline phosphatase synthesis response regulator PhoP